MQSCVCLNAGGRLLARPVRSNTRKASRLQSQSGRAEPFNESAVQVQRLVSRDRKEFLGNQIDILDKYTTEFGDPDDDEPAVAASTSAPAASSSSNGNGSSSSSTPVASPFAATAAPAKPAAVQTKFTGGSTIASPFGGSPSNFKSRTLQEPKGLTPDMGPDPITKPAATPGNFLSRITLTQVVLFCTFSSMILLMLATFSVVLNSGAIRLAGIE